MPINYGVQSQADIDDIMPTFIAPARTYYDVTGVVKPTFTEYTLPAASGPTYHIPRFPRLVAMDLEENMPIAQAQHVTTEEALQVTPSEVGMQVLIGRRSARMAKEDIMRIVGKLTGTAMAVKEDQDLITLFGTVTAVKGGAGQTAVPGFFHAAKTRIQAESKNYSEVVAVVHDYQYHPVAANIVGGTFGSLTGIGLEDASADVFKTGMFDMIAGVKVYKDINIEPDSSDDATGCAYTKEAFCYVKSTGLETTTNYDDDMRAHKINVLADYGYGLYDQSQACRIVSDASEPDN